MVSVLVVGDSLVGESGDGRGGFARAASRLVSAGRLPVELVAHGRKGTTAQQWRSAPWLGELLAAHRTEVLVLSLGTNDAAAGRPWAAFRDDLVALVSQARAAGVRHVLMIWPNEPRLRGDLLERLHTYRLALSRQPVDGLRSEVGPPSARTLYDREATVHPTSDAHTPYAAHVLSVVGELGGASWTSWAAVAGLVAAALVAAKLARGRA